MNKISLKVCLILLSVLLCSSKKINFSQFNSIETNDDNENSASKKTVTEEPWYFS